MSIFNTIGRLTYKTQRLVQDTTIEPVKAFSQGYQQQKANQAKIDEATKALEASGVKVTPDTFKPVKPRQAEFNFEESK